MLTKKNKKDQNKVKVRINGSNIQVTIITFKNILLHFKN